MHRIQNHISTNDSDQELWKLFREGDGQAYSELIRKFSGRLFSYGVRFSEDRDFVKDCVQDVFFTLWNRREHIGQAACVSAYLFKSVRVRIFRERSKWQINDEPGPDYQFAVEFNVEAQMIHDQSTKELSSRIESILHNFPDRQKEIIYLRFYEGLNYEKIALVMGLNRQSVYNLLQKAFTRFRRDWVALMLALSASISFVLGIY